MVESTAEARTASGQGQLVHANTQVSLREVQGPRKLCLTFETFLKLIQA